MIALLTFTLYQAFLSALGALVFGTLLAMAVIRLPSKVGRAIEPLLLAPFFMPPLFIILAVIGLYHETFLGFSVFGLWGILIAHWILNIPLVFFFVLRSWRETAVETIYVAQNLGVVGRAVEWPLISRTAPRAFAIIMLYATLSFTIVLIMGGGPASSTLEIGIYQAIVFSFDLRQAAVLAIIQSLIGIVLFTIANGRNSSNIPNFGDLRSLASRNLSFPIVITALIGAFLLLPLGLTIVNGTVRLPQLIASISGNSILSALIASIWYATAVGILANFVAVVVVWRRIDWLSWLVAAVSPLAIAVLVIIVLRNFINPFSVGWSITVVLSSLALSPLLANLWRQAIESVAIEEQQLAKIYFGDSIARFRNFWWLKLRANAIRNFALAFILAFGDLALFPIFAPPGYENLAILIWRLMASYQIDAAIALGVGTLLVGIMLLATALRVARYVAR